MAKKSGKQKIEKLCFDIAQLKDSDFEEMRKVINEQLNYSHPFKNATANRQHVLGNHNQKILDSLLELRNLMKS